MRTITLLCLMLISVPAFSQVGIGTVTPNAILDVPATNVATPTITDGILIPRIDAFPASNPAAAQNGMLVFLTSASGANQPGFYYWNNPTTSWIGVGSGTANQWNLTGNNNTTATTNFIGTTTNQDLIFRRNSQLSGKIADSNTFFGRMAGAAATGVSNVYLGAEAGASNTSGQENVYIGRRAGFQGTTGSNNVFIGNAAGLSNTANNNLFIGPFAGNANTTGGGNVFIGNLSGSANDTGGQNTFVGLGTAGNTTGSGNTLFGNSAILGTNNLTNATAIGSSAQVTASNAMVLGRINGVNGSTVSTNVGMGTTAPSAKLDIVSADKGILIPRVLLTAANLAAPVTNPNGGAIPTSTLVYNTNTAGTAPDEVTPGFYYWSGSRWLKINAGENVPTHYIANGTTTIATPTTMTLMEDMEITFTPKVGTVLVSFAAGGFAVTGACGQDAIFFNLVVNGVIQKGWQTSAEDVTNVTNRPVWDTGIVIPVAVNVGSPNTIQINWSVPTCTTIMNAVANPVTLGSVVFRAHRSLIVTDPNGNAGVVSSSPPVIANSWSTAGNSGLSAATNFIGTSDPTDIIFKRNNVQAGAITTSNLAFGAFSLPLSGTGLNNVAFGTSAFPAPRSGSNSSAFGNSANALTTVNNATVLGSGAFVSGNNATAVGSRARADLDDTVVLGSVAGFNGATSTVNVGIGTVAPTERLHVAGRALFHDGFSADNAALTYRNNTDYMFMGPQSGGTADGAAISLYGSTNLSNSNAGGLSVFTTGLERFKLTSAGLVGIGMTPTRKLHIQGTEASTTLGQLYLEQFGLGDAFIHMGATNGRHFNLGVDVSTESFKLSTNATGPNTLTASTLMTVQSTGEVGIGTNVPDQKLHVSGPAGLTAIRIGNTSTSGAGSNVALDFYRGGNANTDWRLYNIGPNLTLANSGDELTTIEDKYQFQGTRFIPMTDGTIALGQSTFRWSAVFAVNGAIQTSDARDKKDVKDLDRGLSDIMKLRPVSFSWQDSAIDNNSAHLGFLAQQLQEILPEVVVDAEWVEDENGTKRWQKTDKLGVKYAEITPVLVKAIQQQQQTIESLQDEVALLKTQLISQEEILERLKKLESEQ